MFSPLELVEFTNQLRFAKRNMVNLSSVKQGAYRIPDFAGIKIFPGRAPVIIEIKSPHASILDHSTLGLSSESTICASQLREAVVHLLRTEGITLFRKYGWKIDDALGEELIDEACQMDRSAFSKDWLSFMRKLQNEGLSFVALIGQTSEFNDDSELMHRARQEFDDLGCSLLPYDELLLTNKVLVDYAARNASLYNYFNRERFIQRFGSVICSMNSENKSFDYNILEFQRLIHRSSQEICVYGLVSPPPPTQVGNKVLAWEAQAYFDIGMLWSSPTHLKGDERLLWAGRLNNKWFVVKERLTDPFKGAVVWYEFGPPIIVEPIFRK